QDHDKSWRVSQENARVWEAAMVDEKISRALTPDEQKQLDQLQQQINAKQTELDTHDKTYQDLTQQRKKLQSDQSTLQFKLNNLKANVQVMQSNLQDAMAAQDQTRVKKIQSELEQPAKTLADWTEQLASISTQIKEISAKLDDETAQITALRKERTAMATSIESMQKREASLAPQSLPAKLSSMIRNAPLMGFMNPSEKIQQIVLPDVQTDVSFMKITTVDRCITCHTNIANKDFTEAKVLGYLEEQTATIRKLNLPAAPSGKATDPSATATNPGGVAAIEFWHNWALKLAPDLVKKNATRLGAISRGIGKGKPVGVVYDGQPLDTFKYDPTLSDENAIAKQNDVLLAAIGAFYRANTDISVTYGKAVAKISSKTEDRPFVLARNIALRYAEELKNGLKASLSEDQYKELENRYRFALVDEVNVARKRQGLSPLSASPVMLAHPQMNLYVDVDSPHSYEAVGCTSCHDGSGQETDFVLAAHVPRDIYVDAKTGEPVLDAQLVRKEAPTHPRDFSNMLAVAEKTPGLHFPQATTQPATNQEPESFQFVDPASGRSGEAITQMAYWKKTYEPDAPRNFELVYHEWDWPMRTPKYIQANCARCHTDVYDIKETAPVLYEGRQLFTQLGCVNCHQMDSIPAYENRKVGTDLRHVTAKLSPAYINTWIWAPKAFRPTTKMPHFFMLENNSSDEEIRRTRQEARAITEYLVRTATPLPPKYIYPTDGQGSAEAGKAIFNSI
ncbi:MAG TPA: c-type cytochrome, partial [Tepidisphaeraceae bacterium]